jgi:hypothetical protein
MRRSRAHELVRFDPETDYERIYGISSDEEFGWETRRALELAMLCGFGVPRISGLMARTREFADHGQKRYDDTVLILREAGKEGLESERGRAALRRLNRIHHTYEIANADYLYTLATFVVVPTRWIARYGWRPLTTTEVRAAVNYYRRLGRLMGIQGIPDSYAGFAAYLDAYERDQHRFSESNRRVALDTIAIFERWFHPALRPLVRRCTIAALDRPLRHALGLSAPPMPFRLAVHLALRGRAAIVRVLPRRAGRAHKHARPIRSYPDGYTLQDLGPAPRACPRR